jgi:hypothetical protein
MRTKIARAGLVAAALMTFAAVAPAHAQSVRLSTRWFRSDASQDQCNEVAQHALMRDGVDIEKTGGASTVGTDNNHTVMVVCDAPGLVIVSIAWRQRPGPEAESAELNDVISRLKKRLAN